MRSLTNPTYLTCVASLPDLRLLLQKTKVRHVRRVGREKSRNSRNTVEKDLNSYNLVNSINSYTSCRLYKSFSPHMSYKSDKTSTCSLTGLAFFRHVYQPHVCSTSLQRFAFSERSEL